MSGYCRQQHLALKLDLWCLKSCIDLEFSISALGNLAGSCSLCLCLGLALVSSLAHKFYLDLEDRGLSQVQVHVLLCPFFFSIFIVHHNSKVSPAETGKEKELI